MSTGSEPGRLGRSLAVWGSELRWFLFLAAEELNRPDAAARAEGRRKRLRALLRRTPWWIDGHLQLGLALVEAREPERDPRDLAAAELSADAAEVLIGDASDPAHELVRYIRGLAAFLRGSFPEAAEQLSGIERLSPRRTAFALEQRGAALLALGRRDEAERVFLSIPPKLRTPETLSALRYFDLPR